MMAKSLRERLMDEFREYVSLLMTNWRVNDVMEWWSDNEEKFPNIAKLARKYLAIPASSAPSERVFSQMKLWKEKDGGWILKGLNQCCFCVATKVLNN